MDALPSSEAALDTARYPVNYGASTGNLFRLSGRGEIRIDGKYLYVMGRTQFQFSFTKMREQAVALGDINNVLRKDKFVRLSVRTSQFITFNAEDEAAATAIVERLPTTRTEEFIREAAEVEDFQQRLESVGGRPWVTPAIVALNVLAFIIAAALGAGIVDANGEVMIRLGSDYGPLTMGGQWWRLLTSTFLHFGLLHLALNMWALWGAGPLVERLYGRASFITLYLFAGLCGSIASLLWHPNVNGAGASGAIFGVFGGLMAFMVRGNMRVPRSVLLAHRNSALAFIAYNLIIGFSHPGIDNAAHLGGLAGGFLLGLLLARPFDAEMRSRAPAWHPVLGTGVALLVLALVSIPVTYPSTARRHEQAFQRDLYWFGIREEAELAKAQRVLGNKIDTETPVSVADALDRDVLPFWREAVKRLGTNEGKLQQQVFYREYVTARLETFESYSKGIRQHDPALLAAAEAANAKVASLLSRESSSPR